MPEYEKLINKMVKAMEYRNKILKKIETDLSALARQAKTEETLDSITYNSIGFSIENASAEDRRDSMELTMT